MQILAQAQLRYRISEFNPADPTQHRTCPHQCKINILLMWHIGLSQEFELLTIDYVQYKIRQSVRKVKNKSLHWYVCKRHFVN